MSTINTNVSAVCKLDASSYIFGDYEGVIFTFNTETKEIRELLKLDSNAPVQQIVIEGTSVGVISDGCAYLFDLDNLAAGVKNISENVNYMLTPFLMFLCDSTYLGSYSPESENGKIERRMDYFQGENKFDKLGQCLVINRYMSTSNVFTLRLDDFNAWGEDTFSFDGEFFNEVGKFLEENPLKCEDWEDEPFEEEMVMLSMLPKHLAHSKHRKITYVDFVKLYESTDKDNPFVVSGGRDRRIIITDFNSHKVYFDETFENVPRCCSHNAEKIFVGCDEGEIVIIDKSTYESTVISLGDMRFRHIDALAEGRYFVAGNDDNAVFCFDTEEMEVVGFEQLEERIKEVKILPHNAVALGADGTMANIEF
jgi:WD40 repeat protein